MNRSPSIPRSLILPALAAILVLGAKGLPAAETELAAGAARGSMTYENTTVELKFAATFVDQKEADKPVILLLTDTKLPTEKWTSEFDMMREKSKWSGVVFFLRQGELFRTDVHVKGQQSSLSGYFDLKLNDPSSQELTGTAKTKEGEKETKLDVTFHAVVK